jgi:hypothetical protein
MYETMQGEGHTGQRVSTGDKIGKRDGAWEEASPRRLDEAEEL